MQNERKIYWFYRQPPFSVLIFLSILTESGNHPLDLNNKNSMISTTIHPDIKRIILAISMRTGMTFSQVNDEVLYSGHIEMNELED